MAELYSWFHVWRINVGDRRFIVESSMRFSEHYKPTRLSEAIGYTTPSGKKDTEEVRLAEYDHEVTDYDGALALVTTWLGTEDGK